MRVLARLAALPLAASLCVSSLAVLSAPAAAAESGAQPNVVLILTDDMRADDLAYMSFTRRLLRRSGTAFSQALSPHPLCCPARAELVTGQYAQNNGVRHNTGSSGGYDALSSKDDLLFEWFRRAGYDTFFTGKFMNGYRGGEIAGLTHNDAAIARIYRPRGVVTYNDGDPERRKGHQTRYTTRSAVQAIKQAGRGPFFSWVGYVAPHGMRDGTRTQTMTVPPKGYDTFRKRWHRKPPAMGQPLFNAPRPYENGPRVPRRKVRAVHGSRVRALYAVDDGIRKIVSALREKGILDDTILVFTSDNGMGMGAHRLMGKNNPYLDTLRVPLLMAGPGIRAGHRIASPTTLVDLPVTLARLAGVTPMRQQDGGDLFSRPADRAVLIQAGDAEMPWGWRGVYTQRFTYVERPGAVEFYDREDDPFEIHNRPDDPRVAEFAALLAGLGSCAGPTCERRY